ncbi:MAG: HAMP domain-containing protein [Spirochaetes bacterium]|nr:HAMP domain-containing protein [Spirochaetota bacterium]
MSSPKKILFEYINPEKREVPYEKDDFVSALLRRIKNECVRRVFLITPKVQNPYEYLRFVHFLEKEEIYVRSVYLNELSRHIFPYIDKIAHEIIKELTQRNCMLLSYGSPFLAILVGAVFILLGADVENAVKRLEAIHGVGQIDSQVRHFLLEYARYNGLEERDFYSSYIEMTSKTPEFFTTKKMHRNEEMQNAQSAFFAMPHQKAHVESLKKTQEEKSPLADSRKIIRKTPFYTSLRFKLISVISTVIVISISGMIFLATYYFKGDNRIRIQQSNLDIAKIMALKVRSDFLSAIETSKAITNEMLHGKGKTFDAVGLLEKSMLFHGIAHKEQKSENLVFEKYMYNKEVLEELQIDKTALETVTASHGKNFLRAFNSDVVVENASVALRVPVMGMAYPIRIKGYTEINSIAVNYIRLDKIQLAFKGEDRIGYVFMVNERGDVIAHQEGEEVLSGKNYISLPIVKEMLKSPQTNGQIRYKDESGKFFLGSFWKIGIGGCGIIATVEEDVALQQVYDMQRRNFYLMMIVLTIVIMIVFFFGTRITEPIIRLVEATKRIKEGQYRLNIQAEGRDEIAELTQSFVEMGIGLEEREKMKEAFGKFVNKEVAEKALRGELRLGGERKNAAVFFSDIRSFTAISEKMEPEEVVEFLNEYMTRMVNCVNNTNGVVDKFIGDAIMAIWGAPVSHGNDTENAINAALMMRHELMLFNQGRGSDKKPIIRIGCGINYGPVLAGQIGSEDRMEYTVIGDTVNLASRIEALNKPFGTDILISEDAYQQVKEIFNVVPMQKIKVKGKSAPQQIYAVLGRKLDPNAPKSLEELRNLLGIESHEVPRGGVEEEVKYEILEQ